MLEKKPVLFQHVVDSLLDPQDFPRGYLRYFSDIDPVSLKLLLDAWPGVSPERKRTLLEQLEQIAEEDTLVSFEDLARALLDDPDAAIRMRAIRLLLESSDPKLVPSYIEILRTDESEITRAEAATALGEYIMLGELEEIPGDKHALAEDALLQVVGGEDVPAVRRRALESLGYSSRPEVATLIDSAFKRQDPDWKASALFAMGRSSDDRWQDPVLQMILSDNPIIRLAAVRAAGELSLGLARSLLITLLDDEDEDEVISAAIWSLSQIGGEDARTLLESLAAEAEDDDVIAYLEDALENLAFTEDLERFDLLSFDPEDFDDREEE